MSGTGSSRRRARQRGFTLLELLVVTAILVLVAALFPVALDHALPSRRVATTTERLISLVHDARMTSLLSGQPVALEVGPHNLRVFSVLADREAVSARGAHGVSFPDSMRVSMLDAQGRKIPELLLYPDGSSSGGRLEIEDGGRRGALVVGAITGRVVSTAPQSVASGQPTP